MNALKADFAFIRIVLAVFRRRAELWIENPLAGDSAGQWLRAVVKE